MKSRLLTTVVGGVVMLGAGSLPAATPVPAPVPAPVQTSPLAGPRKQVADAMVEVNRHRAALARIRAKVEKTFSSKDDWVAAKKDLADAQAAYDAALKPVMEKLRKSPEYVQALSDQQRAQKQLDDASKPQSADSEAIRPDDDASAPKAVPVEDPGAVRMAAVLKMKRLEAEALENDSKLGEAKAKLEAAKKAQDDLESQVTEAMKSDPDYAQESQQLETAQQQWIAAKQSLASAEKAQAAAEAQKAKAASASSSTHTTPAHSSGSSSHH